MKIKLSTNEIPLPPEAELIGAIRYGQLIAILLDVNGECEFVISRESEEGVLNNSLFPSDVEDLAKLVAMIASVLPLLTNVGDELSDDVGCLGHRLSETLGIDPIPEPTLDETKVH